MTEHLSGTVTVLFTDIEGATAAWEKRPVQMRDAVGLHDGIVRSVIEAHGGSIFAPAGDGFAAVFASAASAVLAAIAAQAELSRVAWPDHLRLRVRMGLHTGDVHGRGGSGYFGPAVNRAARVMDAANGMQILISAATRDVLGGNLPERAALVDLGVHELRDVVEPMRLYRVDALDFVSDQRPPRPGAVRSGNLPAARGRLLGRVDDVASVVESLSLARVVTLTGVGGVGKTRLALEVGRQVQAAWPDGVWFAPLETVTGPDELLRSLLSMLSIEHSGRSELESLLEGLRARNALVILDNCEHLLNAVATAVSDVVSDCRHVQVLATSREPLGVQGERTRRVRPLPTGDAGPAVELFRLRADEGGAVVDPERDGDAIVRICRRLDGIPLAIELAAARTRSFRVSEVADRLDDMFGLLTSGRRVGTDRHRTLHATLEWSYGLLSEAEQALLATLSVFAGSFTLAAAEAVGERPSGGCADTFDVLDRLVARSLVVPIEQGDDSRFRLLEPVRQFAGEKLVERGAADEVRARHTQWYLDLLAELGRRWRAGDDQGTWPIAATELADLRVAFDRLVDSGRVDDAQRFVVDAYGPIACHFDVAPMYEWAPRALRIEPGHVGPSTASADAIAAWGAIPRSEFGAAAAWLREGVEAIAAGSRDDGLVAAAAVHHVLSGGDVAVSDEFLERSLEAALASGDLHRQVWVLTYSARFVEALDRAHQLGNRLLIALALSWAAALSAEGRNEARELFWEAAQESHSYLLRNHAAMELGVEQVRSGAPLDGLLLLRPPARDWLLRGDARVWSVLHAMAMGFATTGEVELAARLAGAIGDRPLPFVSSQRRATLGALLDRTIDTRTRAQFEEAGRGLSAAAAVSEALERIEVLASRRAGVEEVGAGSEGLTPRQNEVAKLVARGLTNKQIAQRLAISRYTAETHVRNILERLGAASRSEIATWVARQPSP